MHWSSMRALDTPARRFKTVSEFAGCRVCAIGEIEHEVESRFSRVLVMFGSLGLAIVM